MSAPDVSLILVCYRSSGVAPAAVSSFRREAAAAGLASEVVLVDHSETQAEVTALRELVPDHLVVQGNRGYAAGINSGVRVARGQVLLVGNPDIVFGEGAVSSLAGALRQGFDIVGPQLVAGPWLYPPSDLQRPGALLRQWWAGRSPRRWWRAMRGEVRRWLRVWQATAPVAACFLGGALLAFSRQTWEAAGPWDEGYFLYFEETDWLLRAARRGLRTGVVPGARVTHLWGHAADPGDLGGVALESRERYLARSFGIRGRLVARLVPPATVAGPSAPPADEVAERRNVLWLLSPSPLGTAALLFGGEGRPAARDIAAMAGRARRGVRFFLLAADAATGELLGRWECP